MELFFHSDNVFFKSTTAFLLDSLLPDGIDVLVQSQDQVVTAVLITITSMPKVRCGGGSQGCSLSLGRVG